MEKERQMKKEREEIREKYTETIAKAKREAFEIREKAVQDAKSEAADTLGAAHRESEEIIRRAESCREEAGKEMAESVEKAAVDKACSLVGEVIPEDLKRLVHAKWSKELIDGGFDTLKHMRVPEDVKEAKIKSAFKLSHEEILRVKKEIENILRRKVEIEQEESPGMIAGIVVEVGHVVLDGSLLHRIERLAKDKK
jgi:F0F1-type ATP synthase delta subunit